jgi:iron complex transport system substrate-binding protein
VGGSASSQETGSVRARQTTLPGRGAGFGAASGGRTPTRPPSLVETGSSLLKGTARPAPRGAAQRPLQHAAAGGTVPLLAAGTIRPALGAVRLLASGTLRLLALGACLAAGAAAACEPAAQRAAEGDDVAWQSVQVVDDAGRTIALPHPARRVISLIPAQTEVIAALAGADVLIARTAWDRDPALAALPSVGNALTPSVEWLAAQRPDLVVAWPDAQSRDVVRRLGDVGLAVYTSRVESIAGIRSTIRRLGTLLGADARADSLVHALDAQLDSVRAAVVGRARPTVLYLLHADPPMAAGPGTFIDELIELAGGRNVFADLGQLWPNVALEEIVRRQPDVIIRPTEAALADPLAGLAGRPGWRELRAVRAGRVYGVDPDFYNRPGIGVAEAARGLARRIHNDTVGPP